MKQRIFKIVIVSEVNRAERGEQPVSVTLCLKTKRLERLNKHRYNLSVIHNIK